MSKCLGFCSVVLYMVTVLLCARGQFEAGSVLGTAEDATGAVIPNAAVALKSLQTNAVRQTTSSSTGQWTFVAVSPGRYSVTVSGSGMRDDIRTFDLAVGQRLELNVRLSTGTTTETVNVDASGELIETTSSDLSNVRREQQIKDLPLNSRNFTQLVQLTPGVNNKGNGTNSTNGGITAGRGTSGSVINGNPSDIGIFLFDGIQSVDADANVLIFFPPVDAIQEFKVQTSAAPAAYGVGPSIINVNFRSGTNTLHGTMYEFLRNSALDAKNYFDSPTDRIPPFRLNQFGANLSGPIVIPHLLNGRDKLFFFIDYEGKRQSQSQTYISTVPTPAFRLGDFSALGRQLTIPGTKTALPNNRVASIDPTSRTLVNLFPLPNTGATGAIANNFLYNGALINTLDQGDLRIDYRHGPSSIFARYSQENGVTYNPGYLPPPAIGGGPGYPGITTVPTEQAVLGYGRSFGPNNYYEARAGYSRLVETIVTEGYQLGNTAERYGIPNANAGNTPGFTNIVISNNASLGDLNGNLTKVENLIEFDQAMTMVRGRHEIKVGANFMWTQFAFFSPAKPNGSMNFSGAYTGYGLADFLYGRPVSSTLDVSKFFTLQRYRPSIYVQDSCRITSNLTLNYGLRDDLFTPWTERHDRLAGFDPANGGSLVPVGTGIFPGRSITDGQYRNFGPRFGFAYNINSKTVLRGGAGIFYAYETYNSNPMSKNAPFNGSLNANNSTDAAGWAAASPISTGFPAGRPDLFPTAGAAFQAYQRRNPNNTINEYNLNLQRQISSHDVLTVAYVGQTGTHILVNPNINQAVPGPGAVAARRPYPNFADGTLNCYCATSAFNSLQMTYQNRLSSGLDFQAVYTLGHSIDSSSGNANLVGVQDPRNLNGHRGNSDFDIRHAAVLSWSYKLPFGHGQRFGGAANGFVQQVIGGWQLNSIDNFSTGSPFTPVMATSTLNSGSAVQWADRIGSGKVDNPSIRQWFNSADFRAPTQYQFGNVGRNILYGPGTMQVDASLFKDFNFTRDGARRLQMRVEAFNVLNTPQFNNPNAQIGSTAVGTITSAGAPLLFQRTSRQIQIAAKIYF